MVQTVRGLTTSVQQLSGQMEELTNLLPTTSASTATPSTSASTSGPSTAPPTQVIPAPHELFMPIPEQYAGDLCSCGHFLLQCSPIFSQQPSTYATDQSRVSIALNLLRAAQWASALWESDSPICISFSVVMTEMKVLITLFRGKKLLLGYYPSVRAPSQLPVTLLSSGS